VGRQNLFLRVGLALSIVLVAIGLTFAAPNGLGSAAPASVATPAASIAPVVAGYQAAPLSQEAAAPSASIQSEQHAATLVALATTIVLLAIFVILFSYRPRPGGVRASHR
jgi:hypothetical protein